MDLNKYIEHTLLKPDTTTKQIEKLCQEAIDYDFVGVCVPPFFVKKAAAYLKAARPRIVTVVGFPMGYDPSPAKVEATKRAINDGADEIDMVVNIAAVKDANWSYVSNDIYSVATITHLKGKIVKVILETALLSGAEIEKLCEICKKVGIDYVKTSTGVNATGATIEAVAHLKQNIDGIKIKASGGIKTLAFAKQLIEAGATRIGTSSGINIIKESQVE